MPEEKDVILFVCTGNTCRSPMAAELLRHEWRKRTGAPALKVGSAGLAALDGEKASEHARAVMQEAGLDLAAHFAASLSEEIIREVSLILVMTRQHREQLIKRYPAAAAKTFVLKEYAGITENTDVDDPYGGTLEKYRRIFNEIRESIEKIALNLERSEEDEGGFRQ